MGRLSYQMDLKNTQKTSTLSRNTSLSLLSIVIALTLLCYAFFCYYPDTDLSLSLALYKFHHKQGSWYSQLLYLLRRTNFLILYISLGYSLFHLIKYLRSRAWHHLTPYLYVLTSLISAGVILSDWLIKPFFKRARPGQVIQNLKTYTPPFKIGLECDKNCSFVSGEVAVATAFLAFLVLIPAKYRQKSLYLIALWIFIMAGVRMAQIGHYLSDTIFAILLILMMLVCLHLLFFRNHAQKK